MPNVIVRISARFSPTKLRTFVSKEVVSVFVNEYSRVGQEGVFGRHCENDELNGFVNRYRFKM